MSSHVVDEVVIEDNQTHTETSPAENPNGSSEELATGAEQHARSVHSRETQRESKHGVQQPRKKTLAELPPVPKLRPAMDVLNRMRYDADFDDEDHVVGYRDRHDGVQELCASLWKSDTTDEEFIPQHRIKYFKRKSDNEVVWDRFMRLDLVFGSGIKPVGSHISWLQQLNGF